MQGGIGRFWINMKYSTLVLVGKSEHIPYPVYLLDLGTKDAGIWERPRHGEIRFRRNQ